MTFFITSAGPGQGADLGGLAGADAHCQSLARAAGAGSKTWRAYLSPNGRAARTRLMRETALATVPGRNAKGAVIATGVADLHSDINKISKATAIDETGQPIKGRAKPLTCMHHDWF
jgi:hypothetical protein